MRLQRLILNGFGRFQGRSLELDPGLNLVYGPNEAGKSTLQSFLAGMLYGFKRRTQRREYTEDLARFRPWAGGEYRGALEYWLERADQRIRVERQFEPGQEQVRLYDRLTGADLTARFPLDRRKELLFAQEHLGLPEELFRSTAWVGQLQVSRLEAGRELVERFGNLQQSGREDLSVQAALAWLEERARSIGTERASARPYGRAVRALTILREELERAEQAREQTRQWEARLTEIRAVLAAMEEELAELHRRLGWARYREAADRLARAEEVQRRWRSLRAEAEEGAREAAASLDEPGRRQLEALQGEMASLQAALAEAESEMATLRACGESGAEALAALDGLDRELAQLGPAGPRRKGRSAGTGLAVAGGVLVLAAGAVYGVVRTLALPASAPLTPALADGLAALLGLVGLLLILSGVSAGRRAARVAAERQRRRSALEAEMARVLAEVGATSAADIRSKALRYAQVAARRDGLQARLAQAGGAVDRLPEEAAQRRAEAGEASLREANSLEAALGSLVGAGGLAALAEEVEALRAQLQGEAPAQDRPAAALQDAVRHLEGRRAALTAQASDLAARVETVLSGAPDTADLRRELAQVEEERAAYAEELAAIQLAREGIEAVSAEIHREYAPQLNAALSRAAERLTGGRYRQVRLDGEMALRVVTADDRTVEAAALSGGTVDQLYFSLRLALLDLLTQGQEPVPLLLDDPFVQYDDQRTQEAMDLLAAVAQERQVLLLTCHRRELALARALGANVIMLEDEAAAAGAGSAT